MFLQDVTPAMYKKIAALPGALHNLWTYVGLCGKSNLEKYHHSLAHYYANVGMRWGLADCLYLQGTTRHNITLRF
jgi:hypothetical protein